MTAPPAPQPDGPEPMPRRRTERTDTRIAVALAGPILFLPPVMALAERSTSVFGVPAIVVYLFGVWLVGIIVTALAARSGRG